MIAAKKAAEAIRVAKANAKRLADERLAKEAQRLKDLQTAQANERARLQKLAEEH
jgi:hypothetical protein